MKRIIASLAITIISQASIAHDIEVKSLKVKAPMGSMVYTETQHFVRLINNRDTEWPFKFEYTHCPTGGGSKCETYNQTITLPPHYTFEDRRSLRSAARYYAPGKYRLCGYTDVFGDGSKHAEDCVNIEIY